MFIANPPLWRISQSATIKHKMRHISTNAARILNSATHIRFQFQIIVDCVVPFTHSADSKRSRVLINYSEIRNAINNIIPPDEKQNFLWDPECVFWVSWSNNKPWALKKVMHAWCNLKVTFAQQGIPLAWRKRNIRLLDIKHQTNKTVSLTVTLLP
jgi:hypothetical protein